MEEADGSDIGYLSKDDGVSKLQVQFEGGPDVQEDDSDDVEFEDPKDFSVSNGVAEEMGPNDNDDGDEASILEAMFSGRRSRNRARNQHRAPDTKAHMESDGDELDFMEYNDMKGSRSNWERRRQRGRRQEEAEPAKASTAERKDKAEEHKECDDDDDARESISQHLSESETNRTADDVREKGHKHAEQAANKKFTTYKENAFKSKVASKGRKQKVATKGADNTCEKCGEQFESKNKLHKLLGETGLASLKHK